MSSEALLCENKKSDLESEVPGLILTGGNLLSPECFVLVLLPNLCICEKLDYWILKVVYSADTSA